jgi:hypothetical protein
VADLRVAGLGRPGGRDAHIATHHHTGQASLNVTAVRSPRPSPHPLTSLALVWQDRYELVRGDPSFSSDSGNVMHEISAATSVHGRNVRQGSLNASARTLDLKKGDADGSRPDLSNVLPHFRV